MLAQLSSGVKGLTVGLALYLCLTLCVRAAKALVNLTCFGLILYVSVNSYGRDGQFT